jgi:hypothetical protein
MATKKKLIKIYFKYKMKFCINHPDKKAFSICHGCGRDYCELCLDVGEEFYYCKTTECQELLKKELHSGTAPLNITCPNCSCELELSEEERISGKAHCPECEALIIVNTNPPKVLNKENYVELLSSLNQGDIALIKSVLDDAGLDYYVFGQNFLSVDPLIQPAKFFVNENQIEEAKELLKDFELHIWGTSNKK